ncbi:MAG: molybdenum cofactor guanylyltransferase [Acidimicrobiia bacterium]
MTARDRAALIGVVLAGGASRRMGTDKALVEVAGVPMISRVATALEQAAEGGILISGREGRMLGYECVPDQQTGFAGPLVGVATVMERAEPSQALVVVGVDHPFVRGPTLRSLAARFDGERVVVPVADDVRQVTVAIYPASLAGQSQATLKEGGSLQTLLDAVPVDEVAEADWREWGEDGRSWFGADTVEAVAAGLAAYGSPLQ